LTFWFNGAKLLISQQWRTLTVLADNLSTGEGIATKKTWDTNSGGQQEEQTTNSECEDPLQLQDMWSREELANSGSYFPKSV
jgi:hypothetical protein